MNEDRKLSTSDLVDAADRAERRRVPVTDGDPGPDGRLLTRDDVHADDHDDHDDDGDRHDRPRRDADEPHAPLFVSADADGYRTRWSAIQTGFVDEPRRAVEQADALVSELMTRLTETFTNERRNLEGQWEKADKVSTEDLRIAMQRYRSFFERLLTM
jgi:hypothetical protein